MGAPSYQFLCILYGAPLRPVSSHTIGGLPSDQFLRLLNGGPSVQFLRLIFFQKFVHVKLSLGGPHIFEFPEGGQVPPLAPPPAGAHGHAPRDFFLKMVQLNLCIFGSDFVFRKIF